MSRQSEKKHTSSPRNLGELRIIGGKWRSRKLAFPAVEGLRPSPSRIRETLFNWLTPNLHASNCLDLFAGSGALGFEALSRGAGHVTMVEQNQQVVKQLLKNKALLLADELQIIKADATKLSTINGSFDIVFCDPPFNKGFVEPLIEALSLSNLLSNQATVYIETEKKLTSLTLPNNWEIIKEKVAGDVRSRLIKVCKH